MKRLISWVSMIMCVPGMCTLVNADMLNFDYVSNTDSHVPIPNGYGGFNWNRFSVVYGPSYPGYGYNWGRVSGNYTASIFIDSYDKYGEISVSPGSSFDFNRVFLTYRMNSTAVNTRVLGYLAETLKYDSTVPVWCEWHEFNFMDIDKLVFSALPDNLVMDNFTFNEQIAAVPIPGAALLGVLGLCGAGWRLRRSETH